MLRRRWTILLILLGVGGLLSSGSAQRKTAGNGKANNGSLPVYPGAVRRAENRNGTRVLELRNVSVRFAWAAAYDSKDSLEQVLRFYQTVFRSQDGVIQCTGGVNVGADLSLDQEALVRPESCEADQFAVHGIELKGKVADMQRIVVLRPTKTGTTFALVSIQ